MRRIPFHLALALMVGISRIGAAQARAESAAPPDAPPRTLMEEGRRRYGAGDYAGALACFEAAARRAGGRLDPARAHFNAAATLYRLDRLDEAETLWKDALRTGDLETQAAAWYNLARVEIERAERLAATGQAATAREPMTRAIESLRNAIRLAPDDLEAKINFEWARRRLDELEEQARKEEPPPSPQTPGESPPQKTPDSTQPEAGDEASPAAGEQPQGGEGDDAPRPAETPDGAETAGSPRETPAAGEREMTAEDAERLLDALRAEEEALRRRIRRSLGPSMPVEKDW